MDLENTFRKYFDGKTAGMNREERNRAKMDLSRKLCVSVYVINNWLLGYTVPKPLERKAINTILGEKIY